MTIDEFMRDIAPKMKKGYVFYDSMSGWQFCKNRPFFNLEENWWEYDENDDPFIELLEFDIEPFKTYDFINSLRKVGI